MSLKKKLKHQRRRRLFRVRGRLLSRGVKYRVTVSRSLNHIYAQIIDDKEHKTLVSFSSLKLKKAVGDKSAVAKKVGLELGKLAKDSSIESVFFDRGSYLYHGRVHALADGLRESGLKF